MKCPEKIITKNYKGFMIIKCDKCGMVKSFCSRQPITHCICDCGNHTELNKLKRLYVNCECGMNSKYLTNMTEQLFDAECIECGYPVTVQWNQKKYVYTTVR